MDTFVERHDYGNSTVIPFLNSIRNNFVEIVQAASEQQPYRNHIDV